MRIYRGQRNVFIYLNRTRGWVDQDGWSSVPRDRSLRSDLWRCCLFLREDRATCRFECERCSRATNSRSHFDLGSWRQGKKFINLKLKVLKAAISLKFRVFIIFGFKPFEKNSLQKQIKKNIYLYVSVNKLIAYTSPFEVILSPYDIVRMHRAHANGLAVAQQPEINVGKKAKRFG